MEKWTRAVAAVRKHSGPPPPAWMGGWGRYISNEALIGDGFTKSDRAASEQAVVMRAPLLDWDLVSYVRSLPPDILLSNVQSKATLKQQLAQWPHWFIHRRKGGFAYNLRWFWAASNFTGMRYNIDPEAQQRFDTVLASPLKQRADKWTGRDIFGNFREAWKLLAWSTFEQKMKAAVEGSYIEI